MPVKLVINNNTSLDIRMRDLVSYTLYLNYCTYTPFFDNVCNFLWHAATRNAKFKLTESPGKDFLKALLPLRSVLDLIILHLGKFSLMTYSLFPPMAAQQLRLMEIWSYNISWKLCISNASEANVEAQYFFDESEISSALWYHITFTFLRAKPYNHVKFLKQKYLFWRRRLTAFSKHWIVPFFLALVIILKYQPDIHWLASSSSKTRQGWAFLNRKNASQHQD